MVFKNSKSLGRVDKCDRRQTTLSRLVGIACAARAMPPGNKVSTHVVIVDWMSLVLAQSPKRIL